MKVVAKKRKLASPKTKQPVAAALPAATNQAESVDNSSLDKAIVDCVTRRLRSTVRIRPLPNRCRLADLYALCPSAVAARLPWNRARCRHKGVAFLEFANPEIAAKHAAVLQGSRALGGARELATSIPPVQPDSISASQYNTRRVVVSSLEGRIAASQLLELAPGAQRVRFPEAGAGAGRGRHAPNVAVITFADARQALDAVLSCQGAVVGGGKTSWMLEKIPGKPKPKHLAHPGADRRQQSHDRLPPAARPARCTKLERRGSGVAVAAYETEAACAADLAAWPAAAEDPDWPTVTYGHRKVASSNDSEMQRSGTKSRLIVANLLQGTKKSTLLKFLADNGLKAKRLSMASDGRLALINFETATAASAARIQLLRGSAKLAGEDKLRVAYSLDQLVPMTGRKKTVGTSRPRKSTSSKAVAAS
uniref:RRM domain-containing protein n=1 Tax=Macrostomum lignano TaxID=282301 RepID=A0A1I8GWQ3_9PLAT